MGAQTGAQAYERLMGYVAATSPQNKVGPNARTATYYYGLDRQGVPINIGDPIPSPYGHYVQKSHQRQAAVIQRGLPLDSAGNPKIASFQQNLMGNLEPLTSDIHNSRALGLTDKGGKPSDVPDPAHYGYIEGLQQNRARGLDLLPAEYQEASWLGAGDITGLRSPPDPFLKVFEARVALTAQKHGLSKEEVLRRTIRGEMPLLSLAPAAAVGAVAAGQPPTPAQE